MIVEVPDGPALEATAAPCRQRPAEACSSAILIRSTAAIWTTRSSCGLWRWPQNAVSRPSGSISAGPAARSGTHERGRGEQDDLRAALGMLDGRLPAGVPAAGWPAIPSGRGWLARVAASGAPLAALCLIAPPLSMFDFAARRRQPERDTLRRRGDAGHLLPDRRACRSSPSGAPAARVETIDGADHFFFGKLFPLGELRSKLDWPLVAPADRYEPGGRRDGRGGPRREDDPDPLLDGQAGRDARRRAAA